MPKRKILFEQGGFYHIYNRGAARQAIFRETADYRYMLWLLRIHAKNLNLTLLAWCLMPNHFHLLLRQEGQETPSTLLNRVCHTYSLCFNRKYGTTGTLIEGRFKAKPVSDPIYLLQVCLYIHANPARAGLVTDPLAWPWSNLAAFLENPDDDVSPDSRLRSLLPPPDTYQRHLLALCPEAA